VKVSFIAYHIFDNSCLWCLVGLCRRLTGSEELTSYIEEFAVVSVLLAFLVDELVSKVDDKLFNCIRLHLKNITFCTNSFHLNVLTPDCGRHELCVTSKSHLDELNFSH